jgi:hypothetical protein
MSILEINLAVFVFMVHGSSLDSAVQQVSAD